MNPGSGDRGSGFAGIELAIRWLLAVISFTSVGFATAEAQELPIFDTHIHYSRPAWSVYSPEDVLKIFDRAGVRRALVSSTPDDGTLKLYEAAPHRIVPELRPYRERADISSWHSDPTIVPYIEERLRRGIYKGIGEFHLYGGQTNTPVVRRVTELAVEKGLFLHAHSDEAAIRELFAIESRVKILWAHAGMSSGPAAIGQMLDRYPNLWAELAIRTDMASGGSLDPEWRALFLRYPDRVMIGTDTWVTSRWEALPGYLNEMRAWLNQLPREVAEKIAFGNAERLFTSGGGTSPIPNVPLRLRNP
ncbi:MAG TPA: amidohydrolase family protein [Methylomirabilota bacterium]|nr:amidohydrolase family protein [Methylomirabilota bacterium]